MAVDDPDDLVRFEVQAALDRRERVIPVLVDNVKPLRRRQLPAEFHELARLNALEFSYGRSEYDSGWLLDLIQRALPATPRTAAAPIPGAHDVRSEDSVGDAAQQTPEDRATRVLTDALNAAYSITDKNPKAGARTGIAEALAATDPDRAERTAQSIIDEFWKAFSAISAPVTEFVLTDLDDDQKVRGSHDTS